MESWSHVLPTPVHPFFSEASSQGDRDHQDAVEQHAENGLALHVFEDPLLPVHGMTDKEIAKHHQARGEAAGGCWGPGDLVVLG